MHGHDQLQKKELQIRDLTRKVSAVPGCQAGRRANLTGRVTINRRPGLVAQALAIIR